MPKKCTLKFNIDGIEKVLNLEEELFSIFEHNDIKVEKATEEDLTTVTEPEDSKEYTQYEDYVQIKTNGTQEELIASLRERKDQLVKDLLEDNNYDKTYIQSLINGHEQLIVKETAKWEKAYSEKVKKQWEKSEKERIKLEKQNAEKEKVKLETAKQKKESTEKKIAEQEKIAEEFKANSKRDADYNVKDNRDVAFVASESVVAQGRIAAEVKEIVRRLITNNYNKQNFAEAGVIKEKGKDLAYYEGKEKELTEQLIETISRLDKTDLINILMSDKRFGVVSEKTNDFNKVFYNLKDAFTKETMAKRIAKHVEWFDEMDKKYNQEKDITTTSINPRGFETGIDELNETSDSNIALIKSIEEYKQNLNNINILRLANLDPVNRPQDQLSLKTGTDYGVYLVYQDMIATNIEDGKPISIGAEKILSKFGVKRTSAKAQELVNKEMSSMVYTNDIQNSIQESLKELGYKLENETIEKNKAKLLTFEQFKNEVQSYNVKEINWKKVTKELQFDHWTLPSEIFTTQDFVDGVRRTYSGVTTKEVTRKKHNLTIKGKEMYDRTSGNVIERTVEDQTGEMTTSKENVEYAKDFKMLNEYLSKILDIKEKVKDELTTEDTESNFEYVENFSDENISQVKRDATDEFDEDYINQDAGNIDEEGTYKSGSSIINKRYQEVIDEAISKGMKQSDVDLLKMSALESADGFQSLIISNIKEIRSKYKSTVERKQYTETLNELNKELNLVDTTKGAIELTNKWIDKFIEASKKEKSFKTIADPKRAFKRLINNESKISKNEYDIKNQKRIYTVNEMYVASAEEYLSGLTEEEKASHFKKESMSKRVVLSEAVYKNMEKDIVDINRKIKTLYDDATKGTYSYSYEDAEGNTVTKSLPRYTDVEFHRDEKGNIYSKKVPVDREELFKNFDKLLEKVKGIKEMTVSEKDKKLGRIAGLKTDIKANSNLVELIETFLVSKKRLAQGMNNKVTFKFDKHNRPVLAIEYAKDGMKINLNKFVESGKDAMSVEDFLKGEALRKQEIINQLNLRFQTPETKNEIKKITDELSAIEKELSLSSSRGYYSEEQIKRIIEDDKLDGKVDSQVTIKDFQEAKFNVIENRMIKAFEEILGTAKTEAEQIDIQRFAHLASQVYVAANGLEDLIPRMKVLQDQLNNKYEQKAYINELENNIEGFGDQTLNNLKIQHNDNINETTDIVEDALSFKQQTENRTNNNFEISRIAKDIDKIDAAISSNEFSRSRSKDDIRVDVVNGKLVADEKSVFDKLYSSEIETKKKRINSIDGLIETSTNLNNIYEQRKSEFEKQTKDVEKYNSTHEDKKELPVWPTEFDAYSFEGQKKNWLNLTSNKTRSKVLADLEASKKKFAELKSKNDVNKLEDAKLNIERLETELETFYKHFKTVDELRQEQKDLTKELESLNLNNREIKKEIKEYISRLDLPYFKDLNDRIDSYHDAVDKSLKANKEQLVKTYESLIAGNDAVEKNVMFTSEGYSNLIGSSFNDSGAFLNQLMNDLVESKGLQKELGIISSDLSFNKQKERMLELTENGFEYALFPDKKNHKVNIIALKAIKALGKSDVALDTDMSMYVDENTFLEDRISSRTLGYLKLKTDVMLNDFKSPINFVKDTQTVVNYDKIKDYAKEKINGLIDDKLNIVKYAEESKVRNVKTLSRINELTNENRELLSQNENLLKTKVNDVYTLEDFIIDSGIANVEEVSDYVVDTIPVEDETDRARKLIHMDNILSSVIRNASIDKRATKIVKDLNKSNAKDHRSAMRWNKAGNNIIIDFNTFYNREENHVISKNNNGDFEYSHRYLGRKSDVIVSKEKYPTQWNKLNDIWNTINGKQIEKESRTKWTTDIVREKISIGDLRKRIKESTTKVKTSSDVVSILKQSILDHLNSTNQIEAYNKIINGEINLHDLIIDDRLKDLSANDMVSVLEQADWMLNKNMVKNVQLFSNVRFDKPGSEKISDRENLDYITVREMADYIKLAAIPIVDGHRKDYDYISKISNSFVRSGNRLLSDLYGWRGNVSPELTAHEKGLAKVYTYTKTLMQNDFVFNNPFIKDGEVVRQGRNINVDEMLKDADKWEFSEDTSDKILMWLNPANKLQSDVKYKSLSHFLYMNLEKSAKDLSSKYKLPEINPVLLDATTSTLKEKNNFTKTKVGLIDELNNLQKELNIEFVKDEDYQKIESLQKQIDEVLEKISSSVSEAYDKYNRISLAHNIGSEPMERIWLLRLARQMDATGINENLVKQEINLINTKIENAKDESTKKQLSKDKKYLEDYLVVTGNNNVFEFDNSKQEIIDNTKRILKSKSKQRFEYKPSIDSKKFYEKFIKENVSDIEFGERIFKDVFTKDYKDMVDDLQYIQIDANKIIDGEIKNELQEMFLTESEGKAISESMIEKIVSDKAELQDGEVIKTLDNIDNLSLKDLPMDMFADAREAIGNKNLLAEQMPFENIEANLYKGIADEGVYSDPLKNIPLYSDIIELSKFAKPIADKIAAKEMIAERRKELRKTGYNSKSQQALKAKALKEKQESLREAKRKIAKRKPTVDEKDKVCKI